jgi:beta-lactam-binding protein with PASTA domain
VTVPDVRGADLDAAQGILLEAGVLHEEVNCEVPADYAVSAQRPAPGTMVEAGTRVALQLEQQHGSGIAAPPGGWPRCQTAGFR